MKVFKKQENYVIEYSSIKKDQLVSEDEVVDIGELSDGYHTYKELYEFRKVYNAALFNEWARLWRIGEDDEVNFDVHKSWRHSDGELCFGGGWFIVSAMLPTGLISNHYKAEDWDLFKIPEVDKALFEFDGHTSEDVLNRLKKL